MHESPVGVTRQLFRLAAELRRQTQLELANQPALAEAGLRPLARAVLMIVNHRGPSSQREISDVLAVDASDLVVMLDQLEEAGFIERRRDPADRRRNQIQATTRGKHAAARLAAVGDRAESVALQRLTERERKQLSELIGRALGEA